jgi:predicted molibdopterin-dependent oxidoreductase YjgC
VNAPTVEIILDGRPLRAGMGTTLVCAMLNAGQWGSRISVSGELRGPLCAMGVCHECRVTIDGVAHQRACMTVVASGMLVETPAGID